MEMLGYQARAPRGVKLSKPPPRKLTPEEVIKERLHTTFNNGIQELSKLDQSKVVEMNDNEVGRLSRMASRISDQTEMDGSSNCNIKDMFSKQRARAPRIAKLCKPRPLRHRLCSTETDLATTGSSQSTEQANKFPEDFFSVKSEDEAEDKILSVIETLDSLDHTSTRLFQDIFVKYGSQMEKNNPSFIRSCLACVEEFLKRDCADDGVRSVLRNILQLRKQSWCQSDEVSTESKGDQGKHEKHEEVNLVSQKSDKTEVTQNDELKVCRATSYDSGYGDQDDVVLWSSEDSFIQDLSENLMEHSAESVQREVFMDNGTQLMTNHLDERNSDQLSCNLSENFGKPTMEEKQPKFSAGTKWSDIIKKPEDKIKSVSIPSEFTKLKGLPIKDNQKGNHQAKIGVKEKSDMWTKETENIYSRHRDSKSCSSNGGDQDSWRKATVPFRFGFPRRMTTVPEEEGTNKANTAFVPQRPKHLIRKLPVSEKSAKIVIERHPLGPGSDPSLIAQVEESLPKSIYSASGRRSMFKKYNTAVCFEDIDSDDLEELEHIVYRREELLVIANSPLSKRRPKELSYLCKLFPEVCLQKAEKYFSSKEYQSPSGVLVRNKEGVERDHVIKSSQSNSNANSIDFSKVSFQNPDRKIEFGAHKGFPYAGFVGSSNKDLENGKSSFGCNANFTATDFSSLISTNGPVSNPGDCKTNTVQRNGFGRPSD